MESIQTDPETHPFSYSIVTGVSVRRVKRPGRESEQSWDISGFFRCVVKVFTVLGWRASLEMFEPWKGGTEWCPETSETSCQTTGFNVPEGRTPDLSSLLSAAVNDGQS